MGIGDISDSPASVQGLEHLAYLDSRISVETWSRSQGLRQYGGEHSRDHDRTIAPDRKGSVYRRRLPLKVGNRLICVMLQSPGLYPVGPRWTRFLK